MLKIFSVNLIAFAFSAQPILATTCDFGSDLIAKIEMSSNPLSPSAPKAGDNLTATIAITVNSTEKLKAYTSAIIEGAISSQTSRDSLIGYEFIEIANDVNGLKVLPSYASLKIKIPENFGGSFLFVPYISFEGASGNCVLQGGHVRHLFNIEADPEHFDLTSPEISSISLNQNKYVLGDTARILITATDKSRICTKDLIDQGSCELHRLSVANFYSSDSIGRPISIITNPTTLTKIDETHYYLDVPLVTTNPKYPAKPGTYTLDITINDEWGNRSGIKPRDLTFEVVDK